MAPLPLLTPPDMIGVFLMVRAPQGRGWFPPPVDLLPSVWGFPHIRVSLEIYTEALHIPPKSPHPSCLTPATRPGSRQCHSPPWLPGVGLLGQANKSRGSE